MIHYTCDRCKRVLDPDDDLHYVVKLETHVAMELADTDTDGERDHLLEIHEVLERTDDANIEMLEDEVYHSRRYDLCAACYHRFMRDPIGQEFVTQLDFSQN